MYAVWGSLVRSSPLYTIYSQVYNSIFRGNDNRRTSISAYFKAYARLWSIIAQCAKSFNQNISKSRIFQNWIGSKLEYTRRNNNSTKSNFGRTKQNRRTTPTTRKTAFSIRVGTSKAHQPISIVHNRSTNDRAHVFIKNPASANAKRVGVALIL